MNNALFIPRPGVRHGPYPERVHEREPGTSYLAELVRARLLSVRTPTTGDQRRFLQMVHDRCEKMAGCDNQFVVVGIRRLRAKLAVEGMCKELVAEVFALINMTVQKQLNRSLYDQQFLAAWLMLDRRLIEMQTGEGKTLAIAVAAATCALAGMPVHVVTSNDYLVARDATHLEPLFHALGLTVGIVTAKASSSERMQAYRCDIVYCTAQELVFDYLRDHLAAAPANYGIGIDHARQERKLRGLCMAIVDEADSVLIDEARTPLILSDVASNPELSEFYRQALFLAAQLGIDKDYRLDRGQRLAHLTTAGQARAALFAERIGGDWHAKRRREETLCLALAAQHLFLKDVHYLVRGQQIIIIDDTTGRQAQGRVWSRGLHQLIEAKEGCAITQSTQTLAQITFQRFFARYLRISGISGTVAEAEDELLAIYGLPVVRVPLRFSCRRKRLPARVFPDKSMQWRYVADRVRELTALGQPVLIGTGSVNDSDALSTQLAQAGVPHTVLNARNDANEAHIVAQAGQRAAVTVSTNMAGRGTDIGLGPGVAALGGLYVIACQANDSRRIDRQLYGRCARQGDPGSVEQLYCMEDRIRSLSIMAKILGCFAHKSDAMLPRWLTFLFWLDQSMKERYRRREQWFLFLNDRIRDRQLAFVSPNE